MNHDWTFKVTCVSSSSQRLVKIHITSYFKYIITEFLFDMASWLLRLGHVFFSVKLLWNNMYYEKRHRNKCELNWTCTSLLQEGIRLRQLRVKFCHMSDMVDQLSVILRSAARSRQDQDFPASLDRWCSVSKQSCQIVAFTTNKHSKSSKIKHRWFNLPW